MASLSVGLDKERVRQVSRQLDRNKRKNMHEGIAPWCDCCVCEAEPYWAEVAEEMGINLSDYEDDCS
ncbi:hypothetical protein [Photobacterium alginatilyticum]|uniref:Uncharacterized protein n=1 Tax=Photobacterium alginatilyticum TaxID=1775171 RepID=A0ABW9YCG8_9GAMM|nr:hypothetical protein [Photobacterium alginatilyticum]NBI51347.1 hypothetical protein [Photobacterium alginatilyticum]